jgi:hypothetical protein
MRVVTPLILLAAALACLLATVPAHARARVFVASYGNDANPCTFGSPCKTFQHAHDVVDAGGEITAIDSAGFGPINITKAVTVTSPEGIEAGIVVPSGGVGITITAGPNDAVSLRGLMIDGQGTGAHGIQFNSGQSLAIANSVIRHHTGNGIWFVPDVQSVLSVSETRISDNGLDGVFVDGVGQIRILAVLNRVEINNNQGIGILADGTTNPIGVTRVIVTDSVFNGFGIGVYALNTFSGASEVTLQFVRSTLLTYGNLGIIADGPRVTLNLNNSTVITGTGQTTEAINGAVLQSYGNNDIDGSIFPPIISPK